MTDRGSAPASRARLRLLLFAAVALAAFGIGFLAFDVNESRILVRNYGYYSIALTFAWAVIAFARLVPVARIRIGGIAGRERLQAGALCLGCALVAVLTTPVGYKILYDEMVLQATASNMHQFREMSTVMRAYWVDGVFVPLDSYVDKRPFFFPFLVSLLHDLTGYRESNAFALNIALLPIVLGQVYLIARQFAGHGAAMAGVVALGTLSTLAHGATGAGMDMVNLAMILLVAQLAIVYLEAPDERRLAALLLAAVLLAQTRYESSLYVAPVALVAIEGWRRAGRLMMPPAAKLAPLLLVPYAIHNTYLSGTPLLWELRDNAQTRFGWENLAGNLERAAVFFFNVTPARTNSIWLSVVGFIGLAVALVHVWRHRRGWRVSSPGGFVVTAIAAAVAVNLMLLMFYYWGQLDDPAVMRLSLPFAAVLALAVAFLVQQLPRPANARWLAAGGAVAAYLWSGLIANAQHTALNTLDNEISWERRWVESLPPGDRLIITNKSSVPWMIARTPSIPIDYARRRGGQLRFQIENKTFREILVFQKLRPTNRPQEFQVVPEDRLPDWFVLQPVTERRFGARLDRVSRLVDLRPEPPESGGSAR